MENIQSADSQGRVADAPSGHWTYRLLPRGLWPFAQLARWDRPIGWQLLMWPCWWSTALAFAFLMTSFRDVSAGYAIGQMVWFLILFAIGAIAMRGAGCTYNDLVDQEIDNQVERTRSRPLPSGQVTRTQAKVFLVAQALVGFLVLIQFNEYAIIVGLCSLLAVAIYPFMKRFTDWPQLFLGFAFSWGAFMGWAATFGALSWAPLVLYLGCILWTIGYDTIYAHQDKEDDALVGVRSTARLFGEKTKLALGLLYGGALALFAFAFALSSMPWVAYAGLAIAAIHMARQIIVLDIDDADQCLTLFKSNTVVGLIIFLGLLAAGALNGLS